jgi:hypothetical protein
MKEEQSYEKMEELYQKRLGQTDYQRNFGIKGQQVRP